MKQLTQARIDAVEEVARLIRARTLPDTKEPGMADLDGLIERLEKATGPITGASDIEACIRLSPWYADDPRDPLFWTDFCRALQGSVDAALALVGRLQPDSIVRLSNEYQGYWEATVRLSNSGQMRTAPLAILLALLKALRTQPTNAGNDGGGR